jgi:hypothetical protein
LREIYPGNIKELDSKYFDDIDKLGGKYFDVNQRSWNKILQFTLEELVLTRGIGKGINDK